MAEGKSSIKAAQNLRWHGRLSSPTQESAFQCSDDVYDIKICGDSILCGLRNGTIEIWNKDTLTKETELTEQQGEVQVAANEDVVVGISTDSTVCVWDRRSGKIKGEQMFTIMNKGGKLMTSAKIWNL